MRSRPFSLCKRTLFPCSGFVNLSSRCTLLKGFGDATC
jgi:hypothetical protein